MGFLGGFLTGDVLDEAELEQARADGIVLHVRKLKAAIAYDSYRAPGKRFNGKRVRSSGGVLVTTSRILLWAGGVRQLDLQRFDFADAGTGGLRRPSGARRGVRC